MEIERDGDRERERRERGERGERGDRGREIGGQREGERARERGR